MTLLLYLDHPYMKEFTAEITGIKEEWIELDRTAFYPGGGGQDSDTGWIDDTPVIEVRKENEKVLHRVPGGSFTVGQHVNCRIDWERRYELMKGHTAEHLIFSALSKLVDEIELVKISIKPERKSLIVRGQLDWDTLLNAQEKVNEIIENGLWVECLSVSREDPMLQRVRVKLERIFDKEVRIIKIGDFDMAACGGIHVGNTKEIENVMITKFTSARPAGDFEVEFEVGARARRLAFELAGITLRALELLGAHPHDMINALHNMKKEVDRCREAVRILIREKLNSIEPERAGDVLIYSGIFPAANRKDLIDAANRIVRADRRACVLIAVDESITMIVARSPDLSFDSREILAAALKEIGGRGGGKPEFAVGGSSASMDSKKALGTAVDIIRQSVLKEGTN